MVQESARLRSTGFYAARVCPPISTMPTRLEVPESAR